MGKEKYTLILFEGNGYTERTFADPEKAKGFADATANICSNLVAILFDRYNGLAGLRSHEIWYCEYSDALEEG